jgi:hypothetical protein
MTGQVPGLRASRFGGEIRVLLCLLAAIYATGIWWGVPWGGWAPDEVPPSMFLDAMSRHFSGGWYDKYPPMHFYLNAVLYVPFVLAARAGWLDLSSRAAQITLLLVSRALSIVMALGAVGAIYVLADELYGRPGATFAAAIAGVTLPFVFYAKLANVDVPYLCWFAWSMVCYARVVRRGGDRDALWFAITAATAVETKDNAYGFYVLPMLHIALARPRALLVAIPAGLVAFLVESNLLFNFRGFVDHVRAVAGVGADLNHQTDNSAVARALTIARLTIVNLAWAMTWPAVLAAVAGIALEIRRRRFLWLLLPIASYFLFFVTTITSVFDRYLLGVFMLLAVFAGGWIAWLLREDAPRRRARMLACTAGVVWMAWYGGSIDLMMLNDSRYTAARWLRERTSPTARIAALGPRSYLPGIDPSRIVRQLPGPAIAPDGLPDFIVINAQVMRRGNLPPLDREWWAWLSSGNAPYRVVATFETKPAASLLTYTTTFRNGVEDLYTNLDKVGPPIVIYQRTAAGR